MIAAPAINTIASAASPTTSTLSRRPPAPLPARPPSLSASAGARHVSCAASARPNSRPVSTQSSADAASTAPSIETSWITSARRGGISIDSHWLTPSAIATPPAPPTPASSTLSVSSCRIWRRRPAPSAARSETSRARAPPRAISSVARFTHASSRTKPTATTSAAIDRSGSRANSTRIETPTSRIRSAPGNSLARSAAMPASSASSSALVTPGRTRAGAFRSPGDIAAGGIEIGNQRSVSYG